MTLNQTELHSPTPLIHLEQSAAHWSGRHRLMGDGHAQPLTPDLTSGALDRRPVPPSTIIPKADPRPRHVLPRDLPSAIKHLDNQELDRLIAAARAEQKRRGTKPVVAESTPVRKQRLELVCVSLTTGKLNAVRAAFRAGVKPTLIARQFGLSDADVRGALASDEKKR
jgi:hypothetical protein